MPGARDLLTRHPALAQRTATVRAGVVNGVETATDVEEGDLLSRRLDTPRLAWSNVSRARDPNELPHVSLLVTHSKRPVSLASKPHVSGSVPISATRDDEGEDEDDPKFRTCERSEISVQHNAVTSLA